MKRENKKRKSNIKLLPHILIIILLSIIIYTNLTEKSFLSTSPESGEGDKGIPTPVKLVYQISPDLSSGIEINDASWELAGNSTDIDIRQIGRQGARNLDAGFVYNIEDVNRFDNFTSARLILPSRGNIYESLINLTISGAAVDFVTNFTDSFRPSSVERTLTQIEWIIDEEWAINESHIFFDYYTPNIAPIINEIINRPGWDETEKTIAIFIDNNNPLTTENNHINIIFNAEKTKLELSGTAKDTVQNEEFINSVSDKSALVSMIFTTDVDFYVEYGTLPESYTQTTEILTNQPAYQPVEVELKNLVGNTRYYYKANVRKNQTENPYQPFEEKNFTTRKEKGQSFSFSQVSDTHFFKHYALLLANPDDDRIVGVNISQTIFNQISESNSDFVIDTGDTIMNHIGAGFVSSTSQKSTDLRYQITRSWYENITKPLYLVLGNHESETGWTDGTGGHTQELYDYGLSSRLKYWPNPTSTTFEQGGGNYEDYYAFDWGDALFITLDVNRYMTEAPATENDWHLGTEQLNWLNNTLKNSDKKWKFIFAHHIVGGAEKGELGYNYGDGGGNYSNTGDQKIINHLMEQYNAQIFFYGHIHFFAHDWANWSDFNREKYVNYVVTSTSGGESGCPPERAKLYDNEICARGYTTTTVSPYEVTFSFINYSSGTPLYTHTIINTEPNINLISPVNESSIDSETIEFTYNYTDLEYDNGKNCSIYLDGNKMNSEFGIISGTINTFSISPSSSGEYTWKINCSDGALSNESETRYFTYEKPESGNGGGDGSGGGGDGGGDGGSNGNNTNNGEIPTFDYTSENLQDGIEINMLNYTRISILIGSLSKEIHYISLLEVQEDKARFKIESTPVEIYLSPNEDKKIDVDGDSINELYIKLNVIDNINNAVTMFIQELSETQDNEINGGQAETTNAKTIRVIIFILIAIILISILIYLIIHYLKIRSNDSPKVESYNMPPVVKRLNI